MITNLGAKRILSWFTGVSTYNGNPLYVGFSKTTPTIAGTGVTEPSNSSYSRVALNTRSYSGSSGTTVFGPVADEADGGSVKNSLQITFPETYDNTEKIVQDWGECTHVCLFGSATGSDLLAFEELTTPIHPGNNLVSTIAIIRPGDMSISLKNAPAAQD